MFDIALPSIFFLPCFVKSRAVTNALKAKALSSEVDVVKYVKWTLCLHSPQVDL